MDLSPPTSRTGAAWLGREPTPTQFPPQTLMLEALEVAEGVDTPSPAQGGSALFLACDPWWEMPSPLTQFVSFEEPEESPGDTCLLMGPVHTWSCLPVCAPQEHHQGAEGRSGVPADSTA